MNEFWNLDPIYTGFDDPTFETDMAALRQTAADYAEFAQKLPGMAAIDGLKQGIALEEKLTATAMKLAEFAQLRQCINTRDSEAGSRLGQVMQILSGTAGAQTAWKQWI